MESLRNIWEFPLRDWLVGFFTQTLTLIYTPVTE